MQCWEQNPQLLGLTSTSVLMFAVSCSGTPTCHASGPSFIKKKAGWWLQFVSLAGVTRLLMEAEQLCTEGVSFSHQRESPCPQTVLTSDCTHPNMTTQHCPLSFFGQLHFVCWQQANWMIRELSGLCRGHFPLQTFGRSEAWYTFRKINRNSTVTHLHTHS